VVLLAKTELKLGAAGDQELAPTAVRLTDLSGSFLEHES
jgi:hypothetical protein